MGIIKWDNEWDNKLNGVLEAIKLFAHISMKYILTIRYWKALNDIMKCSPYILWAYKGKIFKKSKLLEWLWNNNITFIKHFLCLIRTNYSHYTDEKAKSQKGKWQAQQSQLMNRETDSIACALNHCAIFSLFSTQTASNSRVIINEIVHIMHLAEGLGLMLVEIVSPVCCQR